MLRRCLALLIVAVTVSSFAPPETRSNRGNGKRQRKRPHTVSVEMAGLGRVGPKNNFSLFFERTIDPPPNNESFLLSIGREALAVFLIATSVLLVAPASTTAAMTPEIFPTPSTTTTVTPTSTLSNSFLTISDELNSNDLRIQQNFEDLPGQLKEQLKRRASQQQQQQQQQENVAPDPTTTNNNNNKELKIQQKYLNLAGDLQEELKFRAQQGKEKVEEKAQAVQEKQQAAAEIKAAKLKEYDDMFDQAEKERNEFYSKKIINSEGDGFDFDKFKEAVAQQEDPTVGFQQQLEETLREENRLKAALAENSLKDQDATETKVERSLLKISLAKVEKESAKLRKDIRVQESLETIRQQRQTEEQVYQDRFEENDRRKQEQVEKIRLIKEREQLAMEEIRARKKQEVQQLKFSNSQILFESKFDALDRFQERKDSFNRKFDALDRKGATTMSTTTEEEGAASVKME